MTVNTDLKPGEIIVDSARTAKLIREHNRLSAALGDLVGFVDDASAVATTVREALAATPDFDVIPPVVLVDGSWADCLPTCVECGHAVEWSDALLMPCSTVEDGDVDSLGIIHRCWCPTAQERPAA